MQPTLISQRRQAQLQRLIEKRHEADRQLERSQLELRRARFQLRDALSTAHTEGASLQELGDLLGVSRQRIHQLLKET